MLIFYLLFGWLDTASSLRVGDKELLLVQAVWRHGDRAPLETYPLDPYQEDAWQIGGSGWGQLSPLGMEQHLKLGKLVRERYITGNYTFISPYYDSHEIYVRSTDVNRTIISALSNMAGMWSQPDYGNRQGLDLPIPGNATDPIWPPGFVPIAIHTVDDDTDFIGNADAVCPRQDQLDEMMKTSPEMSAFLNSPDVVNLLQNLTTNCGKTIDIDNLWVVTDSFLIEGIWQPDFRQKVPWYSDELNQQANVVNDQGYLYKNGVFNNTLIMNGLDIGIEVKKIRGGSLTNDILMHANLKVDCWRNNALPNDPKCKWANKLKYYAYSAHDETVYAFFACLGIQSEVVLPHGYPKYSAATFFELWYDYEGHAPVFRLMYHDGDGSNPPIRVITDKIAGCFGQEFCPLSVYADIAATVRPDMPMDQLCLVDPRIPSEATTPKSAGLFSAVTGVVMALALWGM